MLAWFCTLQGGFLLPADPCRRSRTCWQRSGRVRVRSPGQAGGGAAGQTCRRCFRVAGLLVIDVCRAPRRALLEAVASGVPINP